MNSIVRRIDMNIQNEFLLNIGKKTKKGRIRYWDDNDFSIRLSSFQNEQQAGLWFKTKGCSYDRRGGCIMCDYSIGTNTSVSDMIRYVEKGLSKLPSHCSNLLISPSGSMFDESEVPKEALIKILDLLSKSSHDTFSFETRADTISDEKVKMCQEILKGRLKRIYIGLETANPWALKYSVNKQMRTDDFLKSVDILHRNGVNVAANILISMPFFNENECITLAVKSAKWAIKNGVDECFLFPVHVKEHTTLKVLYDYSMYTPPSLWQLVEVISRLGPELYSKIRLSWYTSYGAYNVIASPTTCEKCYDKVIDLLDHFSQFQDQRSMDELINFECSCKYAWQEHIGISEINTPVQKVKNAYDFLGKKYIPDWWKEHSKKILSELSIEADDMLYKNNINNVTL